MEKNWRFVWQENMYWGSCEPCTASVFSTQVRSSVVNWKIGMRRAVRQAVATGQPLDAFTSRSDFQQWCIKQSSRPRAGEKFAQLTVAAKLLQWVDMLKDSLPDFVFAVSEFGLVPRMDKDGNPRLDDKGHPMLYRRRKQENIRHLSGLFMSDYDHLPFPPQELYEKTRQPGYPFKTRLAHLTSSGEGLRLVSECILGLGNIADLQYLQAQELGMLHVKGTTGKYVTDNSCVNADKLSFCPRLEDILFIDEDKLFHF
jgi:hypothetical protein